jgi:hypothetical protein
MQSDLEEKSNTVFRNVNGLLKDYMYKCNTFSVLFRAD